MSESLCIGVFKLYFWRNWIVENYRIFCSQILEPWNKSDVENEDQEMATMNKFALWDLCVIRYSQQYFWSFSYAAHEHVWGK